MQMQISLNEIFWQVCRYFFLKPLDRASILWIVKNYAAM